MPDIVAPFRKLDPREVHTFVLPSGEEVTGNFFFDPTVFEAVVPQGPAEARLGNLGRNVFSGPGICNVDVSLGKRFQVADSQQIDFRADLQNVFNHAEFNLPASQTVAQTWSLFQLGRVTRTFGARQIQFYLRYSF